MFESGGVRISRMLFTNGFNRRAHLPSECTLGERTGAGRLS